MKKGIALLLTVVLAAGISLPAYAQDTDQNSTQKKTIEVSLDSIENIMKTYSLDVQTDLNDLKSAKYEYDQASDEMEDYYENLYDIAKVQYEQNVASTVLGAKQDYLSYCADYDQYTAAQSAADNAKKAYQTSLVSLTSGFVSQNDCDTLKDTYQKAQTTLDKLDQQIDQDRTSLRTLLNLPDTVNMSVQPLSAFDLDFSEIPNINYSADQIVMLGLDSKIKAAKLTYEYQDDNDLDSHTVDNAYITLQQVRESEKEAFKKLYDSLTSSYTVYQQDLDQVQRAQQTLNTEKQALALGYSSQQSVDEKTNTLDTLQSTLTTDRNTLLINYLSYNNMKKGYSTGS